MQISRKPTPESYANKRIMNYRYNMRTFIAVAFPPMDDRLFSGRRATRLLQLCALRHVGHESQQASSPDLDALNMHAAHTRRTTFAAYQTPNTTQDCRYSVQSLDNTTAELPYQHHQVSCCFTPTSVPGKESAARRPY